MDFKVELQEKHKNYLNYYKPNDLYWGIGIENECYLEFSNKKQVNLDFFINNGKRERYSIDYFQSYKPDFLTQSIEKLNNIEKLPKEIPILMNAHSFEKMDIEGNHKTMYTKENEDNPKYLGKSLFEILCENDSFFSENYLKTYIFDGDTIEFINSNFYKQNINSVTNELIKNKEEFLMRLRLVFNKLGIFKEYGKIDYCRTNYPFVSFLTNKNNYTVFNNMTYHFNFTLPTKLDEKCNIKFKRRFIEQHRNAIHLIQWIEPILIAIYNTPDFFSEVSENVSKTSQRCAKSRYIGIGTYNTDKMEIGKILQIDSNNNHLSELDYWWFKQYYQDCEYTKEDKIGLDINFHKHKNHGIELRFFDYFPEERLQEILLFIILLLDFSLENPIISPVKLKVWNDFVVSTIKNRQNPIPTDILKLLTNMFNCEELKPNILETYKIIYTFLFKKYYNRGICYLAMAI
jgi:hypothetical protein